MPQGQIAHNIEKAVTTYILHYIIGPGDGEGGEMFCKFLDSFSYIMYTKDGDVKRNRNRAVQVVRVHTMLRDVLCSDSEIQMDRLGNKN